MNNSNAPLSKTSVLSMLYNAIVNDKTNLTKSCKETLIVHFAQPMYGMLYQRHLSA